MRRITMVLILLLPSLAMANSQQDFFNRLRPLVNNEITAIKHQRTEIAKWQNSLKQGQKLSLAMQTKARLLASSYRLKGFHSTEAKSYDALLARVDIVPASMVLAQAADESAWGRSRFAVQGHNLFGQWCFLPGCGIVPKRRPKGATYEVQRFRDEQQAINRYFHNLNTGASYNKFRQLREQLRHQGKPLNGLVLAQGLQHYSSRGLNYVREIQTIIKRYGLKKYDTN